MKIAASSSLLMPPSTRSTSYASACVCVFGGEMKWGGGDAAPAAGGLAHRRPLAHAAACRAWHAGECPLDAHHRPPEMRCMPLH